jgi:hypothetical protein
MCVLNESKILIVTTLVSKSQEINGYYARYEVFTAVKIQVDVFWVVTPCSVVVGYRRFRGPCYIHLLGCDAV